MKLTFLVLATLLVEVLFPIEMPSQSEPTYEDSWPMKQDKMNLGNSNIALSRFAFLIGEWRCEVKLKQGDGTWENLKGEWNGRYILDGHAIEDEYRMTTPTGTLLVLGMNVRAYDSDKNTWNIKWLDGLSGTWTDLGPEELGGVKIHEKEISYIMNEPVAGHAFTRATYANISANHFTWRGERSKDQEKWEVFLLIEAFRK